MQGRPLEKYFFFALLLLTLIFSIFILRPFLSVIVLSIAFAVVLYPMHAWLIRKKFSDWLAALVVLIFFILILFLPALWICSLVFKQSANIYYSLIYGGEGTRFLSSANVFINTWLPAGISFNANQQISYFVSLVSYNLTALFNFTWTTFLYLFLLLLSIYYFLKDGARWKKILLMVSPLSTEHDEKILHRLAMSVKGVIVGSLLMSLIQGVLLGIGYNIFGIPNSVLWGVVAFFVSFIPVIGTGLVSIPAVIYAYLHAGIPVALGLAIWSIAEVLLVANFVSPVVLGKKVDIPPLLMLFSLLGGVSFFGPVGILIGPLVISLLYALVTIYTEEFKHDTIL